LGIQIISRIVQPRVEFTDLSQELILSSLDGSLTQARYNEIIGFYVDLYQQGLLMPEALAGLIAQGKSDWRKSWGLGVVQSLEARF
jgi:hypothetical protein